LNAYAKQATLLHRGIGESTEKDLKLQVLYRCLSEAEHGVNYARQQIDLAREEVDNRTHEIMHLENTVRM
jgi:hypothetical protein